MVEVAGLHLAVCFAEGVAVESFDLRDLRPERGNVREPLIPGGGGEGGVDRGKFLFLAVRGFKQVFHRDAEREWEAGGKIDVFDRLLAVRLQRQQELLGVRQLICGRLLEQARQRFRSLLPGGCGIERIAGARL